MPYVDGRRVSNEEWTAKYGSIQLLHTGPNGDNPAGAPTIDEATGTVKVTQKARRSPRSQKAAKAAIADAMGVKPEKLDIDLSGLDADATETE